MKRLYNIIFVCGTLLISTAFSWGFFGHQRINRLAVFTLPAGMISFYKSNIDYITEASVNPDKRRYSVVNEAARHYLDVDHYGDSAVFKIPRYWNEAVEKYSEDTLKAYGILPWHINKMYYQLRDAMMTNDPQRMLRVSAELGHYIADAHVPLHTTENYNGQLTGQYGIHGFWESRLVELYSDDYDFLVGKASYIFNTQIEAWKVVVDSHLAVDSVLMEEKKLAEKFGEKKYAFETKGKLTQRVYSQAYAKAYHELMQSMVERRMRAAIKTIGNFWFTAWVDAGQPDLNKLKDYQPTEEELLKRKEELANWKQELYNTRLHEN